MRTTLSPTLCCLLLAAVPAALSSGCKSVYYDVQEVFGKEKRHILVDRVQAGREEQEEAREQYKSTYELFREATGFQGGDLEAMYERMSGEYEGCVEKTDELRDRVSGIRKVAKDLFVEWETELGLYTNDSLREKSEETLDMTRERYQALVSAMDASIDGMDAVRAAFQDQVFFLKHNLNAAAIASLKDDLDDIDGEVAALIAQMEAAIAESEAFLEALGAA